MLRKSFFAVSITNRTPLKDPLLCPLAIYEMRWCSRLQGSRTLFSQPFWGDGGDGLFELEFCSGWIGGGGGVNSIKGPDLYICQTRG
jgi:hypothetical protein